MSYIAPIKSPIAYCLGYCMPHISPLPITYLQMHATHPMNMPVISPLANHAHSHCSCPTTHILPLQENKPLMLAFAIQSSFGSGRINSFNSQVTLFYMLAANGSRKRRRTLSNLTALPHAQNTCPKYELEQIPALPMKLTFYQANACSPDRMTCKTKENCLSITDVEYYQK